jgi:hypothetical protein
LSGRIKPGQRVVVVSDAVPDTPLEAEVLSVGVLAETGDWVDRNRRDYTVKIMLLNGNQLGLKPSMRCKAEIFVGEVKDALFVPIQACFRKGPIAYVYVPKGSGYAEKPVTLGRSSELYLEILDGLDDGDIVLLRKPSAEQIIDKIETDPGNGNGNGAQGGDARKPGPPGGGGTGQQPGASGGAGQRPGASGGEGQRPGGGMGRGGGGQQPGASGGEGQRPGASGGEGQRPGGGAGRGGGGQQPGAKKPNE